jgi:heat shock protein HslJ
MIRRALASDALVVGLLLGAVHCGPAPEKPPSDAEVTAQAGLGGTSWRLVKFQGGDETTLTPDDPAKYTIAFEPDGRLSARIDCNRGMGTWKSSAPPQLEFGPLALTRAMCPPGSLHNQIVKQWPYVRSYVMRDGHLFLSLMADGGIYEFEPMSREESVKGAVKGTATYRERMALPPGAVLEATLQDVSRADAPAVVIGQVSLENTYWKLTRLGDDTVTVASKQSEPHLILNSGIGRATGSGGCNRMSGSYQLSGDRLSLGQMVSTMMACVEGMETEQAFLKALGQVSGWSITGRQLELKDAAGQVLARFDGRHME